MTQDLAAKRARYRLKIRERMVIIEQALLHGLKPTAQRFRLNPKTVREWRDRFRVQGPDDSSLSTRIGKEGRSLRRFCRSLTRSARAPLRGITHQDVVATGASDPHDDEHDPADFS